MSRTPSQAGTGSAGGAFPQRPAAYPSPKPAAMPGGATNPSTNPSKPTTPAGVSPALPASPTTPASKSVSKSVSGPVAKPAKPDLFSRRNLILGGSVAGALVLLIGLLVWRPWQPKPPRLNEQPYKIAQFAASSAMDRLPWGQQREYMAVLNSKDDALLAAYKDGKLDDVQYRRALQLGWYDKHLDRMDKFFNRPPGMRMMYIDEKVLGKKMKKGKGPGPAAPGKAPKPKKDEEKSDDSSPLKPEEIDRDDSSEEQDIKKWPADVRAKWMEYRSVLAQRKEFFKEQERQEKEKRKSNAEAGAAGKSGATAPKSGAASGSGGGASPDAGPDAPAGVNPEKAGGGQ